MRNERGELVNDRMRPDTFAYYIEKIQWARNHEIDQQRQEDPDVAPIYETEADVKQDAFTKEEFDKAINKLKNDKTPRPNRVTSELICKALGRRS